MKLLQKFHDWLSCTDPYQKYKDHKHNKIMMQYNDDFLKWAFGETHSLQSYEGKIHSWNNLHRDILIVEQVDHLHDRLPEMVEYWINHEANKSRPVL